MKLGIFQNALEAVADVGRELIERRRGRNAGSQDPCALAKDLMSQKGEALGVALARDVLRAYDVLDDAGKQIFFALLRDELGPDKIALDAAIAHYTQSGDEASFAALASAVEPRRQDLIRRLNTAPGGTQAIIGMREDLLRLVKKDASFTAVDKDFLHLIRSWFNRGFLTLERIDWRTPAHILEKLIQYEAVHEIQGWDDLRRRLDDDRRCFSFFHPALPEEPLIFVEVALVTGLASSVQMLLSATPPDGLRPIIADTAIFYSISNCQDGLKGISFGNFLIKQVVEELRREYPAVKTYATLSPIPEFTQWLASCRASGRLDATGLTVEEQATLSALDTPGWHDDRAACTALEPLLLKLCAHYFLKEKKNGRPHDSVARFHLRNGARLQRICWLGDVSEKGLSQSHGLLVNYQYDLKKIEVHHEAYVNDGKISASKEVRQLIAS